MALAAFEKLTLGRQELERESQVHVSFPGLPKIYCRLPYLWIFVLQFQVPLQPQSKIINGRFWKEIVLPGFSYNGSFSVHGLVCKLSVFTDVYI